jgi:hypothetical protein
LDGNESDIFGGRRTENKVSDTSRANRMNPDNDLRQIARDVRLHPEWLEGMPEDLRQIVEDLNAEILDEKPSGDSLPVGSQKRK